MLTVHLICNAHLDPIWLWPWTAGLDAALATCRTACDMLDRHPELIFTRGEAWVYQQIEAVDPALFARIEAHVRSGRWEIVGGWYIQPDCNQPGGEGLARQIELGKRYFQARFGRFPTVAYNVDSFGHAATLPRIMHAAGQDCYVMMRPQEHELALPARLFRWRTTPLDSAVTTFRIAGAYTTPAEINEAHVRLAASELPPGIEHTMCFVGVGDHGGGPTEKLIQWCLDHREAFPGMRLVFSSPARFFKAVAGHAAALPEVCGELQMHAVGCYSVHRAVKLGVQRAEHMLRQAEVALAGDPAATAGQRAALEEGWKHTCFNQFHDTLGGTCIPSAYAQIDAELGAARAVADHAMQHAFRRRLTGLPDDPRQRIVLLNASDKAFDGYVEFEPWLEWNPWPRTALLRDGQGKALAYQRISAEAAVNGMTRLLFRRAIPAGELDVVAIDTAAAPAVRPAPAEAMAGVRCQRRPVVLGNDCGVELNLGEQPGLRGPEGVALPLPELHLIEDKSDTWSHDVAAYAAEPLAVARWGKAKVVDRGPLMASAQAAGRLGRSTFHAEWRLYAGLACVQLLLTVEWRERWRLLKLVWPMPRPITGHSDGIPGDSLARKCDGRERPVRDFTVLELGGASAAAVGVVCPDVYALDVDGQRLRLTLLRSPLMAHHQPHPPRHDRPTFSDRGEHQFRFAFFPPGPGVTAQALDQYALAWHRPPLVADLTRGMPGARHRGDSL